MSGLAMLIATGVASWFVGEGIYAAASRVTRWFVKNSLFGERRNLSEQDMKDLNLTGAQKEVLRRKLR